MSTYEKNKAAFRNQMRKHSQVYVPPNVEVEPPTPYTQHFPQLYKLFKFTQQVFSERFPDEELEPTFSSGGELITLMNQRADRIREAGGMPQLMFSEVGAYNTLTQMTMLFADNPNLVSSYFDDALGCIGEFVVDLDSLHQVHLRMLNCRMF